MTDSLTALDATFLELEEADVSAHMHIGAVMTFAPDPRRRLPSLEGVRRMLAERLGVLPRYSQKLSEPHTGGMLAGVGAGSPFRHRRARARGRAAAARG